MGKQNTGKIEEYLNMIVCGDCLKVMKKIPDSSIDLIVTSPPYNLKNSTGNGMKAYTKSGKWANAALQNGYSHFDDNMPHDKYVKWQRDCLTEMFRLIKEDGAIFYNHKWRVQDGLLQDRQDILNGFPVRQIIIWRRKGGINFNPGYFLPTYEVIYLIAKPNFKLVPKANAVGDVWEFTQEMKNGHPAPFPIALIDRIISSTYAEVVLDPFMGSGTTAIAALMNNVYYLGIELSPEYVKMAEKRILDFQADLEVDNWIKAKDGWLIGISCKRTIRERWKNVSSSIETYNRFKVKYIFHVVTFDEDLSDDKLTLLGEQRQIFYLPDNSRRLKYAKQHIGLKNYVRPISQLINDIRKELV